MVDDNFDDNFISDYVDFGEAVLDIIANTDCRYYAAIAAAPLVHTYGWTYDAGPNRTLIVVSPNGRTTVTIRGEAYKRDIAEF